MVAVRHRRLTFCQFRRLCRYQGSRTCHGAIITTGKGAAQGHRKTDDTEQGRQREQVRGECWFRSLLGDRGGC